MAGRPTDYKPAYAEGARALASKGATDAEIADFYNVDVRTIYRWKNAHDEFCQALKAGKEVADERVERSLYHRAIGYEQEEVKIFMPAGAEKPVYAPFTAKIAPDTTAAIFWLKNRRPDLWRDKVTHEGAGENGEHLHKVAPDDAFATFLATLGRNAPAPAGGGDGAGAVESESPPEPDHA